MATSRFHFFVASTGIERYTCTSLLDIGPTAEGDVIDVMAENLLDAGKWLKYAGQCVYDTVGYFPPSLPAEGTC